MSTGSNTTLHATVTGEGAPPNSPGETMHPMATSVPFNEGHLSYNVAQNGVINANTHNAPISPLPDSAPPHLPRIAPIPLPLLSPNIPIRIHILITYQPSNPSIYWDISLPPGTAQLAIALGGPGIVALRWSHETAVTPTTLSSITIRIRGIHRPLVIFPVEAGHPIRIIDVMRAVYSAIRAEAFEYGADAGTVAVYASSGGYRDLAVEDGVAANAIRRYFNNRVWWNGISPSTSEVEVWDLHLRGPTRRRFRW